MRSRSCETAAEGTGRGHAVAARTRRGFTLIELIAVVVVLGMVAALVGVAGGFGGVISRQRQAMEGAAALVGLARAEAMRALIEQSAVLTAEDGRLSVHAGDRERSWARTGLEVTGRGRTIAEWVPIEGDRIEVGFDGLGRTPERVVLFDGRAQGGRMWALRFDPVSGAVSAGIVEGDK